LRDSGVIAGKTAVDLPGEIVRIASRRLARILSWWPRIARSFSSWSLSRFFLSNLNCAREPLPALAGVSWRELHLNFADYRFGFLLHTVQAMYWADHFPNNSPASHK
jgi:hypothetical protein